MADLSYHLVHCTAAHSCHERLHRIDSALLILRLRVSARESTLMAQRSRVRRRLQRLRAGRLSTLRPTTVATASSSDQLLNKQSHQSQENIANA